MIVVDTSVWVDYFRGRDEALVARIHDLLDAGQVLLPIAVKVELLGGASKELRPRLKRALGALRVLYPSTSTWKRMERWTEQASAAGHRFGVGDLLIAALAADAEAPVWSLDSDFGRMASLGFVGTSSGA